MRPGVVNEVKSPPALAQLCQHLRPVVRCKVAHCVSPQKLKATDSIDDHRERGERSLRNKVLFRNCDMDTADATCSRRRGIKRCMRIGKSGALVLRGHRGRKKKKHKKREKSLKNATSVELSLNIFVLSFF